MSDKKTMTTLDAKAILRDIQVCTMAWEPSARLLGNTCADEIYTSIDFILNDLRASKADNARLRAALQDAESALSLAHHRKQNDLVEGALGKVCSALSTPCSVADHEKTVHQAALDSVSKEFK